MHGKARRGERSHPIRAARSLRNALDRRAPKMPGYRLLPDKADKPRTKDPPLCNTGCSGPAALSGRSRSRGGGGRMSSRQEAPPVAVVSPCCRGRKPRWVPHPAPGSGTERSHPPRAAPGTAVLPAGTRRALRSHSCENVTGFPVGFLRATEIPLKGGSWQSVTQPSPAGASSRSHQRSRRPQPCPARNRPGHEPAAPRSEEGLKGWGCPV